MADTSEIGIVFDIQHYSIHDGPGIRTTVFLKGCPLRCLWCQNPESQSHPPVLFFHYDRCTGCGACLPGCPQNAIEIVNEKSATDRLRCDNCAACVSHCPNDARTMKGEALSAATVFEEVQKDAIFYRNSQGGVTISGGDPVVQPEFVHHLSGLCRKEGIHVALETCGYASWETLAFLLTHVDLVLYDLKHMGSDAHRACTGVANDRILENVKRIYHELKKTIHIRVPVVPGYNDACENINELATFITTQLGKDVQVHLLPYHNLARDKYARLEASYACGHISPPNDEQMQTLLAIIEEKGLVGKIGG